MSEVIRTVVVGSKFRPGAVEAAGKLKEGDAVDLEWERANAFDRNAVAVRHAGVHLGYIPRHVNGGVASRLQKGEKLTAQVVEAAVIAADGRMIAEPRIAIGDERDD